MYNSQLETFVKSAEAGSFNKASEEMYITAAAVIKQVNSLENSIGVKLFNRTHRGLTLTPAGKSFYCDAKYILNYYDNSVLRAKKAAAGAAATVKIGSSAACKTYQVGPKKKIGMFLTCTGSEPDEMKRHVKNILTLPSISRAIEDYKTEVFTM